MTQNQIKIIYQDKDFLALYKPAGMLTHKTKISDKPTIADWLIEKYPEIKKIGDESETRPGIVHRLDRNTSGVILAAKNQKFFDYLKNLFQNKRIKKTYLALVWGKLKPKKGTIKKPIGLKTGTVKRTVWLKKVKEIKDAITEYKVLKYIDDKTPQFSLIKVMPKTGRTHQIRIHLASIGHPIVGDDLYGKKDNPLGLKRQFLHAESVEFNAEDGKRIRIECGLPEDLKNAINKLQNQPTFTINH